MRMNLKTVGTRVGKAVAIAGVAGALALAVATPSQARNGRIAAAGVGFAAGAVVGAAAANSAYNGYYYNGGGYAPGYYAPGYGAYAYAPGYSYAPGGVWTDSCLGDLGYGRVDNANCQ